MYMYIHINILEYLCISTHAYIYIYVYIYTHIYYVYIHIRIYMYTYNKYIYIIYIHKYTCSPTATGSGVWRRMRRNATSRHVRVHFLTWSTCTRPKKPWRVSTLSFLAPAGASHVYMNCTRRISWHMCVYYVYEMYMTNLMIHGASWRYVSWRRQVRHMCIWTVHDVFHGTCVYTLCMKFIYTPCMKSIRFSRHVCGYDVHEM